jgi:hypothetical protein
MAPAHEETPTCQLFCFDRSRERDGAADLDDYDDVTDAGGTGTKEALDRLLRARLLRVGMPAVLMLLGGDAGADASGGPSRLEPAVGDASERTVSSTAAASTAASASAARPRPDGNTPGTPAVRRSLGV